MNWPLEPEAIRPFAEGLEEIVVVEEKRGVVENQLKEQLYNWQAKLRPLIIGKRDERGEWLLPSNGELTPALIARVLAKRIGDSTRARYRRARALPRAAGAPLAALTTDVQRMPHFCSGVRTTRRRACPKAAARSAASAATSWPRGWTATPSPSRRWAARARPGSARRRSPTHQARVPEPRRRHVCAFRNSRDSRSRRGRCEHDLQDSVQRRRGDDGRPARRGPSHGRTRRAAARGRRRAADRWS